MSFLVSLLSTVQTGLTIGFGILGVVLFLIILLQAYVRVSYPMGELLAGPNEDKTWAGLTLMLFIQIGTLIFEVIKSGLEADKPDPTVWRVLALVGRAILEAILAAGVLSGTIKVLKLGK